MGGATETRARMTRADRRADLLRCAGRLFGERGNDRLVAGGSGGSTLDGGTGNDRIDAVNGKRDKVRCGRGFDRAVIDRKDRVSNCERVTRKRT